MFRQKHGIAPFAYGHAILVGELRRAPWGSAIMVCPITSFDKLARSIRLPVTASLFICVIASKYLYL